MSRDPWIIDLAGEFDQACLNFTPEHARHLEGYGIGFATRNRAGDLVIMRIATCGATFWPDPTGYPTLVMGAWYPGPPSLDFAADQHLILDLLALRPAEPSVWWDRRGVEGLILGPHWHAWSADAGQPVRMYASPWDWLLGACEGVCVLDTAEAWAAQERISESEIINAAHLEAAE